MDCHMLYSNSTVQHLAMLQWSCHITYYFSIGKHYRSFLNAANAFLQRILMLRNIDETGPSSFSSLWYRITFGTTVVFEYLVLFSRQKIIKIKRKWNMHTTSVYILIQQYFMQSLVNFHVLIIFISRLFKIRMNNLEVS